MATATLSIDLVAKLANIERDLGKASSIAERNAKRMEDAYSRAGSVMRSAFAGFASALSVGAVANLVKSSIDSADALSKLSQRTGETVENLAKLQYAGSLADASTEDLQQSLGRLNKVMGEAADGSKEARKALDRFGIEAGDTVGAAFEKIADRVKNTTDQTRIASALNDVLGRSFDKLLPLLKGGADGLKDAGDEADRLGIVIDTKTSKAAERFNDSMTRLQTTVAGAARSLINPLIPSLDEAAGRMQQAAEKGRGLEAVFIALGALAKIPYDVALGSVDLSYQGQIKDLEATLKGLQQKAKRADGADSGLLNEWVYGKKGEFDKQIEITRNQLEALKKYGDKLKATPADEGQPQGLGILPAEPPKTKTGGTRTAKAIDNGQRLVEQLRDQVRATQDLSNVEKLELAIADGKYKTATAGNLALARGYAETLDAIQRNKDAAAEEAEAWRERLNVLAEGARVFDATRTPMEALDIELLRLDELLDAGAISMDTFGRAALQAGQGFLDITDKIKETDDVLNEFAKSGARNIQSAFADFLFDPFENGLAGMAQSFGNTVKRMIAEAVSADLTKRLFGDLSKGGLGTGWLGDLGKLFANADGGVYNSASLSKYSGQVISSPHFFAFARGAGVMGEAGPEAILPLERGASGKLGVRASGGGVTITNNFVINGMANEADGRRAAGQISRSIIRGIAAAARYR
ncbi:MAG: phage tail tape measure protein [Candidatus Accumulibacter sp.]|nr:phage tail tape measure protein [Accumulibacter sp.]